MNVFVCPSARSYCEESLKLRVPVSVFEMRSVLVKSSLELLLNWCIFFKLVSFYEEVRSAKLTAFSLECQLCLFSVYM